MKKQKGTYEKLKKCANPQCTKDHFSSKSGKKKFCSVYCKNQASYAYRKTNYPWYEYVMKGLKKNINILEYLNSRGVINVMHDELVKMGFAFDVALIPFIDPIGGKLFRYENLTIRQISRDQYELLRLNANAKH